MSSSDGYANRLAPHGHKGDLNLAPAPDVALAVLHKARVLAARLREATHAVIHTGAGISTSAGIPDFRGPDGIWTQQQKAERAQKREKKQQQTQPRDGPSAPSSSSSSSSSPSSSPAPSPPRTPSPPPPKRPRRSPRPAVSFEDARPALTHVAITAMHKAGLLRHVISQNVDGLHSRSGLPRKALSELHGNLFVDWCAKCRAEYARDAEASSVGLRRVARKCLTCDGDLTDKALDWEDELPEPDFGDAKRHAELADLHVVAGTSCQMNPARNLPFRGKRGKRATVLVNLSRTGMDDRFGMIVRADCDTVFAALATALGLNLPLFRRPVELLVEATRLRDGAIRCATRLRWDGVHVRRCAPGVARVVYADGADAEQAERRECTAAGYETTLATGPHAGVVKVAVHGEDGRLVVSCEIPVDQSVQIQAVAQVYDAAGEMKRLHGALKQRAKTEEVAEGCIDQFFVSAAQQARTQCAKCGHLLSHARGTRQKHFAKCCLSKRERVSEPEPAEGQTKPKQEVIDVDAMYPSD